MRSWILRLILRQYRFTLTSLLLLSASVLIQASAFATESPPTPASNAVHPAKSITVVYADYRPYSWAEKGQTLGLEVDLLQEIFEKRMGISLKHLVLPWERAQQYVENGNADAFVATSNSKRANYADASAYPVTYWGLALYIKKGDTRFANIKDLSDLKPFTIGALRGNGWVEANLKGMRIHYVSKLDGLPKMLALGRLDVIPENPLVMRSLLASEGLQDAIEEVPLDFLRKEMWLYVSKKSPLHAQMADINTVLQQMKQDGSLQQIHQRYMEKK